MPTLDELVCHFDEIVKKALFALRGMGGIFFLGHEPINRNVVDVS